MISVQPELVHTESHDRHELARCFTGLRMNNTPEKSDMEGKVEDLRYLVLKCSFIVESKLEKHLLDLNAPLQISS